MMFGQGNKMPGNFWFARYVVAAMLGLINRAVSQYLRLSSSTNMAATPLSYGSLGIGCEPPVKLKGHCQGDFYGLG